MLTEISLESLTVKEISIQLGEDFSAVGLDEPYRESQYLICACLDWDVLMFLRKDREVIPKESRSKLWDFIERRRSREPMAYILGKREFYGRDFKVGKGALIPRPETEHLIEWVIESHQERPYRRGIDLCAGPGTIGLTLAKEIAIHFDLVELNRDALAYAEENRSKLECEGLTDLYLRDVTQKLNLTKADLIVSNPPYVPSQDLVALQIDVKEYEPKMALDGGEDGLCFLESMMLQLSHIAEKGCHLYLELGAGQKELLKDRHFEGWQCEGWRHDLARIPRIVRYAFKPD